MAKRSLDKLRGAAFVLGPGAVLRPSKSPEEWTRRLRALERISAPVNLDLLARSHRGTGVRNTLAIMGTAGYLAKLLNTSEGGTLVAAFRASGWVGLSVALTGGTAVTHRGLGGGLPREPLKLPKDEVESALGEIVFFQRGRCVVLRCAHGDHWFVSEDARRVDCVVHRLAGQKSRYRRSPARTERESRLTRSPSSKRV